MQETIKNWFAFLFPSKLILRILLRQLLPSKKERDFLFKCVDETRRAICSSDTLQLPARHWRRDDAARRMDGGLKKPAAVTNLACELAYWLKE